MASIGYGWSISPGDRQLPDNCPSCFVLRSYTHFCFTILLYNSWSLMGGIKNQRFCSCKLCSSKMHMKLKKQSARPCVGKHPALGCVVRDLLKKCDVVIVLLGSDKLPSLSISLPSLTPLYWWHSKIIFSIDWVRLSIFLKLVSPVSFYFFKRCYCKV